MIDGWLFASLIALLANVVKVLQVKTNCREIDSWLLLFAARLLPALLLLPLLPWLEFNFVKPTVFWGATFAAALITVLSSQLYIVAVQQGELSQVTPIQATTPMFMVLCTWLLYDEVPPPLALFFMGLIVISVSFVMRRQRDTKQHTSHQYRALLYSLIAAALFGCSTILDRVAIATCDQHGALVFTAYWHGITILLLLPLLYFKLNRAQLSLLRSSTIGIYVLVCFIAFLSQQYAVQMSLPLANGVTYVKTIVMAHIVIASAIGIIYLKEPAQPRVIVANVITAISGIGLLWSI